jgi:hypothetical protein
LRSASTAAQDVPEETFEDLGHGADVHAVEATRRAPAPTERGVAETIVAGPLVHVAQDRVRLGGDLEPLLGFWVVRVSVGVELDRLLLVGGLDLLRGRRPLDLEDDVIVGLVHAHAGECTIEEVAAQRILTLKFILFALSDSRGCAP